MAYAAFLARRELTRPRVALVFDALHAALRVDGETAMSYALRWRGNSAFLVWRDARGKRHALTFWADNFTMSERRGLRLAQQVSPGEPAANASPWRRLVAP